MKRKILSIFLTLVLVCSFSLVTAVPAGAVVTVPDRDTAITTTADRLVDLQSSTDYGWDWIVTGLTQHSANPSAYNMYGVVILGLLDAYEETGTASYLNAATNMANHMTNNLEGAANLGEFHKNGVEKEYAGAYDYQFLMRYAEVSENSAYSEYAIALWYWNKTNTAMFASPEALNNELGGWAGPDPGAASWMLAAYGTAIHAMGDDTFATGCAAIIVDNLGSLVGDHMALAECLEFLSELDDPATYGSTIDGIITALIEAQQADGHWDIGFSESILQDNSYPVRALAAYGGTDGLDAARKGAAWLIANQLPNGGWLDDGVEHSEMDAEVLRALVATKAPVTIGVNGYYSIQQAIDSAIADDTIIVAAGIYDEQVVIDKALTLLSTSGREDTMIQGDQALGGELGTVFVTNNTDGVQIGDIGQGFTITGIDGPPGLEKAAVYFQGDHSNAVIKGNNIVANGDHGLLTEYGATITGFVISNNEFSGQTFLGDTPGGEGFTAQFTVDNVPRQLVVMGGGSGGGNTSDITFTGNHITGTAGGINIENNPQGNTLVTIDSAGSTITGNVFEGTTTRYGSSLRARGPNAVITGNDFRSTGLTPSNGHLYLENNPIDSVLIAANTFDKGVYVESASGGTIGLSIQGFVSAVLEGTTINVAAGTYDEQVVINKSLTLQGAGDATIIQPSGAAILTTVKTTPWLGTGTYPMAAIVFVDTAAEVVVRDLKIDGSLITEVPAGAVWVSGLAYLETSGTIDNVAVQGYPQLGTRSCGIWTSAISSVSTVEVKYCNAVGYNRGSIYACGGTLTVDFNHNEVYGPGEIVAQVPNGMFFLRGATGSATYNTITDLAYTGETYRSTGIGTYRSGSGLLFGHNEIYNVQNAFAIAGASQATIEYNDIHDCHTGIKLEAIGDNRASNTNIQYNDIVNNDFAIRCGSDMGDGNEAHYNNFVGNLGDEWIWGDDTWIGAVCNVHETDTLDAKYNWWGGIGGPGGEGLGNGDNVTANVDYDPWLTELPVTVSADGIRSYGSDALDGIRSYGSDAIELQAGWNTLSVPCGLKNGADTFDDIQAMGDYLISSGVDKNYLGGYWFNAQTSHWEGIVDSTELEPGKGFYIRMIDASRFPVLYFDGGLYLPSYTVHEGWNLVGSMFGIDKVDGDESLDDEGDWGVASLATAPGTPDTGDSESYMDKDTALNSLKTAASVVVSPSVPGQLLGWAEVYGTDGEAMCVGEAYWVFMLADGTLAGFEVTPFYFTYTAPVP